MVGRIEVVLIGFLGLSLWMGLGNQQQILAAKQQSGPLERKEVEILDARAREVNASGPMNIFAAEHSILIRQVWYMDKFRLLNSDIRSLRADRARRSSREIVLEGNVTLVRRDGAVYGAQKVDYDLNKRILRSIGPFEGYRGEDYVRGSDFLYDLSAGRTRAYEVFARYRLADVNRSLR